MKAIYILNFKNYYSLHSGYLLYKRVGNTPIVEITRLRGDLPFYKYFLFAMFGKMSRRFGLLANIIEYDIKVTEGMEKDVIWNQREDGMFVPTDKWWGEPMARLARKQPPTKKVIRKGFIVDTEKVMK